MNQVILVGEVCDDAETIFDKKEAETKLMRFHLSVPRPFKNREGRYEEDIIKIKVWSNNVEDSKVSLKKAAIIGVRGRISSYPYTNAEGEELFSNDVIADRVTYLTTNVGKID